MLRKILVLTLVLGAAAGITSLGSALFTDTASVAANTFTTGTVDISTSPTTALVTLSGMAPGDMIIAPITVNNAGTLPLRYAVTSMATNVDDKELMEQLELTIKSGVVICQPPAAINTNFDIPAAVTLYGTTLSDLGSVIGLNLIGSPTAGADTGDRLLAAGASETLCFKVTLPLNSNDTFQGAATTATFTFVAEQTTNN
jgi:hypothetical protein